MINNEQELVNNFNPKKAGGQFDPPSGFPETVFSRERVWP